MKGLILKDLLCLKNQMKYLFFIVGIFLLLAAFNKDYSLVAFIIPFYLVMIIISTFGYDEFNNFNSYCNTFPLSRKDVVKSKYLLILLSILTSLVMGFLVNLLILNLGEGASFEELFSFVVGGVVGITIVISILVPFFYKYGVQRGRIMLFIVVIGLSFIGGALYKLLGITEIDLTVIINGLNTLSFASIMSILVILLLIVMYISYKVSCLIYTKKEF